MDDKDRAILHLLQENARLSNAEIGRRVGLVASAVLERIRRLEQRGVVVRHECVLDPRLLDAGILAFIMIRTCDSGSEVCTGDLLCALPGVLEVHRSLGDSCFILKVRVPDTQTLATLLDDHIRRIPSVAATDTRIVVRTVKETVRLPLDGVAGVD